MKLKEFFQKYNGRGTDFDGYYGFQCVDLYRQYCKEILGIEQSPSVTSAYQIWTTYLKDSFTRIKNTPQAIPQLGDIIIWNKNAGLGHGHIAIFNYGNVNEFVSFDQNWPVGSTCHFQNHNYTNVMGWLRPVNFDFTELQITDQTKIDLGGELGIMEIQAIRSKLNDQVKTITALKDDYEGLILSHEKAISEINEDWQTKLTSANTKIEKLKKQKATKMDWWILFEIAYKKFMLKIQRG